jgi:hypothetical protein
LEALPEDIRSSVEALIPRTCPTTPPATPPVTTPPTTPPAGFVTTPITTPLPTAPPLDESAGVEEICSDGIDNDGDGFIDLDDIRTGEEDCEKIFNSLQMLSTYCFKESSRSSVGQ